MDLGLPGKFALVIGSGEGMGPVHRRGARPPSRPRPPSGARRARFAFGVCIRMEFGALFRPGLTRSVAGRSLTCKLRSVGP